MSMQNFFFKADICPVLSGQRPFSILGEGKRTQLKQVFSVFPKVLVPMVELQKQEQRLGQCGSNALRCLVSVVDEIRLMIGLRRENLPLNPR